MSFMGIGSIVTTAAELAAAASTGGASLAVTEIVKQVASKVAQELIQDLGQQMGLPQPLIDAAKGAVAEGMGDTQSAMKDFQSAEQGVAQMIAPNATPTQQGQIASGVDSIRGSTSNAIDQLNMEAVKNSQGEDSDGNAQGLGAGRSAHGGASAAGGGSWLLALAKALGSMLDQAQNELQQTMDGTNWKDAGAVAQFQAQSQEFSLLMNTATNVLKTVGDSLSTMARKD
jgi:hypothetical protein